MGFLGRATGTKNSDGRRRVLDLSGHLTIGRGQECCAGSTNGELITGLSIAVNGSLTVYGSRGTRLSIWHRPSVPHPARSAHYRWPVIACRVGRPRTVGGHPIQTQLASTQAKPKVPERTRCDASGAISAATSFTSNSKSPTWRHSRSQENSLVRPFGSWPTPSKYGNRARVGWEAAPAPAPDEKA